MFDQDGNYRREGRDIVIQIIESGTASKQPPNINRRSDPERSPGESAIGKRPAPADT
jgi:hypothetical protein